MFTRPFMEGGKLEVSRGVETLIVCNGSCSGLVLPNVLINMQILVH